MSTPPPGGSTRMTSAPSAASVAPPKGAAMNAETSMTRRPSRMGRAPAGACASATWAPSAHVAHPHDPARTLGDGKVDELSVFCSRGRLPRHLESLEHASRPFELARRRRENVMDDRELARVDRGLAKETQPFRSL